MFFNEASRNVLMATPRVSDKVADFIINNRPFNDYEELVSFTVLPYNVLILSFAVLVFITHLFFR